MSNASFEVISPVDGRVYATRDYASAGQIDEALRLANAARIPWRQTPLAERARIVVDFVEQMGARADDLAEALSWQMGRPRAQADETPRLIESTRYAAEQAAAVLAEEAYPAGTVDGRQVRRFVRPWPGGVHLSICAWNYPTAMLGSLVSDPLLTGNVVILKHSPQTPLIAEIAAEAFAAAGGPQGVFQSLHLSHDSAEALLSDGAFSTVNFIGSVAGGRRISEMAARSLTRVHLELGGKDPTYIRSDADLGLLVPQIAEGCFSNSGQSCCSVERIYVHESVHDRFVDALREETLRWRVGHPFDDDPDIGPLWREQAADYVRAQIAAAEASGAQRLLGDQRFGLDQPGSAYLAPEILVGAEQGMGIMRDELFGPVACVAKVSGDEDALTLMNDSPFGLTASVWTEDLDAGVRLLEELEAGTVYLNRCDHADPYLPWGGVKQSGLGRNNGKAGLIAATEAKSFHINHAVS
ncbi:MAG: aldehyde dehydrogenase family protein [Pseudomonadota bacterium]